MKWVVLLIAGFVLSSHALPPGYEDVPPTISYQGMVMANGAPFSGTGYFKFALLSSPEASAARWGNDFQIPEVDQIEPHTAVELVVENGLFMVELGNADLPNMLPLPSYVFLPTIVYLRIWFSEDNETFTQLEPDQPLSSVPFAAVAGGVVYNSITADHILNNSITSNKLNWATMPSMAISGFAQSGPFETEPVASGTNSIAIGNQNVASGNESTVSGGERNTAGARAATVSGGRLNEATGIYAFIGGGINNRATRNFTVVAGGDGNRATNDAAAVVGGFTNYAWGQTSFIGGGRWNQTHAELSLIAGGDNNRASGEYAAVVGGRRNRAENEGTFVGGGFTNIASGPFSAVVGGQRHLASGTNSFVGGGVNNRAIGTAATVPGGKDNTANHYSFAAGHRAKALQIGSFVWADSTDADAIALVNDSVTFRASGGYRLFTDAAMGLGAQLEPNATTWAALSDREVKENFEVIDTREILEQVAALPMSAWNYKADPGQRRYIGPVAQDFHAAFGLGNETTINTLDADGVALAAIKVLNAKVIALEAENAELKQRLERMEAILESWAQGY